MCMMCSMKWKMVRNSISRGVVSVTETQKEFLIAVRFCGDFTTFDCDFNGADRVSFDQANASSGTADDRDRTGDSKRRRFKPQDRSQPRDRKG